MFRYPGTSNQAIHTSDRTTVTGPVVIRDHVVAKLCKQVVRTFVHLPIEDQSRSKASSPCYQGEAIAGTTGPRPLFPPGRHYRIDIRHDGYAVSLVQKLGYRVSLEK